MIEEKQKIGFVILTWNSEKVIGKCLESICLLNEISPQIVIIDNGSTDSTNKIIEKYISENQNIINQIKNKENKGTTFSRNEGIKYLNKYKLDFYCILDSDTEISDKAILKMIEELCANPLYGMIGPKMVSPNGVIQMSARAFPTALEKIYKAFPFKSIQSKGEELEKQLPPDECMDSYPVDYLMSACWLIKPEVQKKVGLLDEKIFYAPEDAEYCIRIWKSGYQVAYCHTAEIIHEWQRLSKKKLISKMNFEHIKGLIYMFNKHHYFISTKKLKNTFKGEK